MVSIFLIFMASPPRGWQIVTRRLPRIRPRLVARSIAAGPTIQPPFPRRVPGRLRSTPASIVRRDPPGTPERGARGRGVANLVEGGRA